MNSRTTLWTTFFLLAICLALAGGCVVSGKDSATLVAASKTFDVFFGQANNTEYMRSNPPASIAVLPFADNSTSTLSITFDDENPAVIVRRSFYNQLAALPFHDLELYDTDLRLKNGGVLDVEQCRELLRTDPQKLKSLLGVDAVITGDVTHFDRVYLGIFSQIAVGCTVNMWDLESGKLLWQAEHTQRDIAGGVSLDPLGLALAAVAATWNLREAEMLSQTDTLFREIVSTIEVPEGLERQQLPKPTIALFSVLGTDKPFRAGDEIVFRLVGQPGCRAFVDLGDYKSNIDLAPVTTEFKTALQADILREIGQRYLNTGHPMTPELRLAIEKQLDQLEIYQGTYTVRQNEQRYDLMAIGHLVNRAGGMASSVDAIHTVSIDGRPPSRPANLFATPLDGKVLLEWFPAKEKDLAGYIIETSALPLSGYAPASKTERHQALITGRDNFEPFYVRVIAVDKAGNTSPPSDHVKAVALPVKDLYYLPQPGPALSGTIARPILLRAEKSPYSVRSQFTVSTGGIVYAEPGVEIRFGPQASLRVEGGALMIWGSPGKPVRFLPSDSEAPSGAWSGISIARSRHSLLRHAEISKATYGLQVYDAAPELTGVTITKSSQAGILLLGKAKPVVSCSTIADNEGQGGMVVEGTGVEPRFHNCIFKGNSPFQVQNYSPLTLDLSGNWWGAPSPNPNGFLGRILLEPALSEKPEACGK